ncbi:MAG: Zn-ribbon domain-containing OB-fold protein [Acidimicrobiia bacterium]
MAELDGKPRPAPIATTKPFWDGLNEDEVRLQRCADCGSWVYYPRARCPHCLSAALDWQVVSGRGRIYSWTIGRQPTHPAFAGEVPQRLAVVELEEGVRLTTTMVDCGDEDLVVGRAVEPVFDHGADGMTLLRFRPA